MNIMTKNLQKFEKDAFAKTSIPQRRTLFQPSVLCWFHINTALSHIKKIDDEYMYFSAELY
jgi:hypothetical protein